MPRAPRRRSTPLPTPGNIRPARPAGHCATGRMAQVSSVGGDHSGSGVQGSRFRVQPGLRRWPDIPPCGSQAWYLRGIPIGNAQRSTRHGQPERTGSPIRDRHGVRPEVRGSTSPTGSNPLHFLSPRRRGLDLLLPLLRLSPRRQGLDCPACGFGGSSPALSRWSGSHPPIASACSPSSFAPRRLCEIIIFVSSTNLFCGLER
jgi:hypothetical protein